MIPGGFCVKRTDYFDPDNKVLMRMVKSFKVHNGRIKKTQLQTESHLRWPQFIRYFEWLQEEKLIKYENSDVIITPKGFECFELFTRYYEFMHVRQT